MLSTQVGKNLKKYVSDYVLFDLETTGTSCKKDLIIEISAVKVKGGKVIEEFSTLVNPGIPIPYYATAVNNITNEMVKDSPDISVALKDFLEFIGDNVLVGHNINSFDMKFIYRMTMELYGQYIDNDYVDTLPLSRVCLPELRNHKLVDLAEYYNLSTVGAHRALNDCRMNQIVFENLGKEFENKKDNDEIKSCPKCGGILVKRNGIYGKFLGCSSYPVCRYTQNL